VSWKCVLVFCSEPGSTQQLFRLPQIPSLFLAVDPSLIGFHGSALTPPAPGLMSTCGGLLMGACWRTLLAVFSGITALLLGLLQWTRSHRHLHCQLVHFQMVHQLGWIRFGPSPVPHSMIHGTADSFPHLYIRFHWNRCTSCLEMRSWTGLCWLTLTPVPGITSQTLALVNGCYRYATLILDGSSQHHAALLHLSGSV
jgi:hypothetical protein